MSGHMLASHPTLGPKLMPEGYEGGLLDLAYSLALRLLPAFLESPTGAHAHPQPHGPRLAVRAIVQHWPLLYQGCLGACCQAQQPSASAARLWAPSRQAIGRTSLVCDHVQGYLTRG